jgi:hypothetical protein
LCEECPTSHSFEKLKGDKNVFYTIPSKATNNEILGIISHYDGVLKELNQEWIWIIDFKNYSVQNGLKIEDCFKLIRFITLNHISTLQKILVINQNIHTDNIYKLIKPMISKKLKSKISLHGKIDDLNSLSI